MQPSEWDARFRSGSHSECVPDPFLVSSREILATLPAGTDALDLACGAGRHAVWLAEQNFRVTAVDASSEALALAGSFAAQKNVAVAFRRVDLELPDVDLGDSLYGVICGFFFLHRPLFPLLRKALRPGGLLIYKTYTTDQARFAGRPSHPMHLLEPNELLRLLDDFRILRYEETWLGRGTAAILASKPDHPFRGPG